MNYVPKSITGALIAASIVGATTILPASAAVEAVIMDKASHTLVHQATGELFTGQVDGLSVPAEATAELATNGLAFNERASVAATNKERAVVLVFDIVDPAKLPVEALLADGSAPENINFGVVHSGTKLPGTLNITTKGLTPKVDYTPGIIETGPTGSVVQGGQIITNTGTGIKPTSSVWNGVADPNAGDGSITITTSNHTGNLAKLIEDSSQGGKFRGLNPDTARDCIAQPVEELCVATEAMIVAEDKTREKQHQFMAPFTVDIKTSFGVRMDMVEAHGPNTPLTDDFDNVVSVSPSRAVGTHIPADHPFYNPANPLHPGVAAPVVETELGLVLDPKVINHADGTITVDFPVDAAAGTAVVNPDGSITFTRETPAVGWNFGNQFGHVMNSDLAAGDQLSVWSGAGEHFLTVNAVDATSITVSGPDNASLTFTGLAGGGTGANLPSVHNIPLPGYDINAKWVPVNPAAVDDAASIKEGESVDVPVLTNDNPNQGFKMKNLRLLTPEGAATDRLETDQGTFQVQGETVMFAAAEGFTGQVDAVPYEWDQEAVNALGQSVDGGTATANVNIDVIGEPVEEVPAPEVPAEPTPEPTPEIPAKPPVVVDTPDVPPTVEEEPPVKFVVPEPETPVEPEVPVEKPPVVVDTPEVPVVEEEPPAEVPVEEPVVIEDEPNEKLADTGAVADGLFAGLGALLLGAAGLFGSRLWKRKNA